MYLTKILLFIFTSTLFFSFGAVSSERSPISIFVLGSGSSDSQWTKSVSLGVTDSFNKANRSYIYYIDHLDAGRFDEQTQHDAMLPYLRMKFQHKTPDIFISAGPLASEFSLSHPDLFPSSNRILIQPKSNVFNENPNAIIIETEIDYSSMVKKALNLSKPEMAFIIGDSLKPNGPHGPDKISNELKKENVPYKSLSNSNLSTLIKKVSEIPNNSAIFFTPIYREHEGKGLPPVLVLKKLHEVARAPIFTTSVVELGFGSVGGYLHSPTELGMMAGETALKIIENEPIELSHDGYELIYDWNEVIRWGYQNEISPKADIRFRVPSVWKKYQNEVIVFIVFLFILTVLLIVLSTNNGKLKKVRNALSEERHLLEIKVEKRTKELSILHQEAEKMARIDELTNISNRRAFFELGELIHSQTERTRIPYVIIMLDIDRFKNINDTYGHPAGDYLIKSVANAVASIIKKSDVVARIGGDEFAVILTNTTYDQVKSMAEKIRIEVEEMTIQLSKSTLSVTISMGCAEYQVEDKEIDAVLARADKALYHAKTIGRNKVVF